MKRKPKYRIIKVEMKKTDIAWYEEAARRLGITRSKLMSAVVIAGIAPMAMRQTG